MAKHISQNQWAKYKRIINEFHEDAFQDEVQWYRYIDKPSMHGEDQSNMLQSPITLKGLMNYNYFRTWPLTGYTITGEFDKQSTVLILNVAYLASLGYVDTHNKLVYRQDKDIITHRGDTYLPTGDTFVAQAQGEPLLFILVLKRQENIPYILPT